MGEKFILDTVDTTELYQLSISSCAGKDFRLSFFVRLSLLAQVSRQDKMIGKENTSLPAPDAFPITHALAFP